MLEDLLGDYSVMFPSDVEALSVNGVDVFVFKQKTNCHIVYRDKLTEYTITLDCNMKKAVEVANTIK